MSINLRNSASAPAVTYSEFVTQVHSPVCSRCHFANGGLPNWGDYLVAFNRCALIGMKVASKTMPPMGALSQEQLDLVAKWTSAGCPNDSGPVAPAPIATVPRETPDPLPSVSISPTPDASPGPGASLTPTNFYAIAKTNAFTPICGVCHNSGWSAKNWQVESTAVSYKSLILTRAVVQGSMPPSGPLPNSTKKYISDWYDSITYSFSWNAGLWSSCTDNLQTRIVTCQRNDNSSVYENTFCSGLSKPAASQSCSSGVATFDWVFSSWSSCSATCGGGTQNRTYSCRDSDGIQVDSSFCNPLTEPSISDTLNSCNTQACPAYTWNTYPWSPCLKTDPPDMMAYCGGGTRTRAVRCKNFQGHIVDNSYCSATDKPITSESCNTQPCPPGSVQFDKADCVSPNSLYLEGRVTGYANGKIWIEEVPGGYLWMAVDGDGKFKMANPAGGFVSSCPSKLRGYTESGIYFDNVVPVIKY